MNSKEKDRDYGNYFTVMLDNKNKFLSVEAKIFGLDGTADISPDYDLDYINLIDCKQYRRKLSNLNIQLIDVPTDKCEKFFDS